MSNDKQGDLTPRELNLLMLTSPEKQPRRETPDAPDFIKALELLGAMSDQGDKVDATVVFALVQRALLQNPPKLKRPPGRPPLSPEQCLERIVDGALSIQGKKLARARDRRDLERCRAEAREAFGKNLELLNADH